VSEGRWKVEVDQDRCIGSAVCAGTVPSRFRLDGAKAEPVDSEIDPDEDVLGAADSCPMEAILVTELGTGKVLAPED
jgi:ferredoxin